MTGDSEQDSAENGRREEGRTGWAVYQVKNFKVEGDLSISKC